MFYRKCGNRIEEGQNFCTNCGEAIEVPAAAKMDAEVETTAEIEDATGRVEGGRNDAITALSETADDATTQIAAADDDATALIAAGSLDATTVIAGTSDDATTVISDSPDGATTIIRDDLNATTVIGDGARVADEGAATSPSSSDESVFFDISGIDVLNTQESPAQSDGEDKASAATSPMQPAMIPQQHYVYPNGPVPYQPIPQAYVSPVPQKKKWSPVAIGVVSFCAVIAVAAIVFGILFFVFHPKDGSVEGPGAADAPESAQNVDESQEIDINNLHGLQPATDEEKESILSQLDDDGDGKLTQGEANKVKGVTITRQLITFHKYGGGEDTPNKPSTAGSNNARPGRNNPVAEPVEPLTSTDPSTGSTSHPGSNAGSSSQSDSNAGSSRQSDSGTGSSSQSSPDTGSSSHSDPDAGSSPSDQNSSGNEGDLSDQSSSARSTILDLSMFPNIRSVDASYAGYEGVDISKNEKLEFLNVIGNPITSIDVSHNSSLTALFCDPDVEVTGLDEAGLYFTDLLTEISMTYARNAEPDVSTIDYDMLGRPTMLSTAEGAVKLYTYGNEYGLIESETFGTTTQCTYNDEGLLESYSSLYAEDPSATPVSYTYSYDDQDRLSAIDVSGTSSTAPQETTMTYGLDGNDTGTIEALSGAHSIAYTMLGGKLQSQSATGGTVVGAPNEYTYSRLIYTDREQLLDRVEFGGNQSMASYNTTYDSQGFPQNSTIIVPSFVKSTPLVLDYETNRDGYVTRVVWEQPSNDYQPQAADYAYIKMVGSLEDLPARLYVPTFRFGIYDYNIGLDGLFYETQGGTICAGIIEWDPQYAAFRALGLCPNVVENPNEVALNAYITSHWSS